MVGRDVSRSGPDAAGVPDVPGGGGPAGSGLNGGWEPASLARRFGALMVDWIACLLVSATFAHPTRPGGAWAPVVVLIAEYAFFIGLFGQTPGMWVTRLRCVSYTDGRPIGIPRALLRGLLLALFVPALIMDKQRRGVHDHAAGSIVVSR
jgi:uncharacterized RDD family membrane protein YckC